MIKLRITEYEKLKTYVEHILLQNPYDHNENPTKSYLKTIDALEAYAESETQSEMMGSAH